MIYKCLTRLTKVIINNEEENTSREVDALILSHKYDTTCLYLTLPELYDLPEHKGEYLHVLNEI